MDAGAPAEKLILGVGVYGRTFTLKTDENKLGAPASAAGSPGPYTREGGMLGYNEVRTGKLNLVIFINRLNF